MVIEGNKVVLSQLVKDSVVTIAAMDTFGAEATTPHLEAMQDGMVIGITITVANERLHQLEAQG